jgi:hypothetical protein
MPTPPTEQQISAFGANMSYSVLTWAIGLAQNVFKFTYSPHTRVEITNFLSFQTGIPASTISLADTGYYTIEWSDWLKFINSNITDKMKKYAEDVYDCDNFAFWFHTFSNLCMSINTGGVGFGGIYDPTTNKLLFGHAFNLIVATENGVMKLYLYEPQTKMFKVWEKGKKNILPVQAIQQWEYRPQWLIYF